MATTLKLNIEKIKSETSDGSLQFVNDILGKIDELELPEYTAETFYKICGSLITVKNLTNEFVKRFGQKPTHCGKFFVEHNFLYLTDLKTILFFDGETHEVACIPVKIEAA